MMRSSVRAELNFAHASIAIAKNFGAEPVNRRRLPRLTKTPWGRIRTGILAAATLACGAVISPACGANQSIPRLQQASQAEEAAFLQTLSRLVTIDSGSDDRAGLAKVADYLVARLASLGAEARRIPAPPSAGDVIVGSLTGKGRKSFLLLAHYDTVYPTGTGVSWKYAVDNGILSGPGVLDAKSGIAVILSSLAVLKAVDFDQFAKITVLFNPDEETGSTGSRDLIARIAAEHDFTLSAEPGGPLRLLATSGTARLGMVVTGTAAHAGVAPENGRNALVAASDIIVRSRGLSDEGRGLKFNWTIAQSGQKTNIIPDRAEASADIRYLDRSDVEALRGKLEYIAANPIVPGARTEFKLTYSRPPLLATPRARQFAELAQVAGAEIDYPIMIIDRPFGGASDAAYAAVSGKSAVVESFGLSGKNNHAIYKEIADRGSIIPSIYIMSRTIISASSK